MAEAISSLDKSATTIRDMFAGVAPRYDLLNRVLSGRLDTVWRRRATRALALEHGEEVLDLCCGTGDQAIALQRRGARVMAADFCLPMLALARRKYHRLKGIMPAGLAADALALPFPSGRFAGASVSFGLRNVADLGQGLSELCRVLRPGGRLVVLEFALPEGKLIGPLYSLYFQRILPKIGRLLSPRGSAYSYLPNSVVEFPQRHGFVDKMRAAGLEDAAWQDLTFGTVCLYSGRRPV
ncbi:MAG: ubiquinone/menaquinone biosynthesis methyltransferase [Acidobacteriota bacterium]